VPTRTYEPSGDPAAALDVIVYLHGGGWAVGGLDTADAGARALAAGLGVRVVSVDYRLAPETPFPGPLDDCRAVFDEVAGRPSTSRVLVAGESAGGNLAAALALDARDRGRSLAGQILINPALDASCDSPSHQRYGTGYGLTTADMRRYIGWYAGDAARDDPLLSPLAASSLAGVAPAVVTTAGFDPLRDDGARYASRLVADDVPVAYLPMPAMLHGWWALLHAAEGAREELRRLLGAARWLLG
jgi:acetyl esterase